MINRISSAGTLQFVKKPMKIVAIDFETANYSPESACALGMVSIENGRITDSRSFLIRPPSPNFVFTYLHNISWEDVRNEPPFAEHRHTIEQFVEGARFLAAHNAGFDRKVLLSCYAAIGHDHPEIPYLCTVKLARQIWNIRPTTLPDVCRHLRVRLDHHNASSDALACARIVTRALQESFPIEKSTLGPPSYKIRKARTKPKRLPLRLQ